MTKLKIKRFFSVCMEKLEDERTTFIKEGLIFFSAFGIGMASGGFLNKKINKKLNENIISQQNEMIKEANLKNSELHQEIELLNKKRKDESHDTLIKFTSCMALSYVIGCFFS